MNNNKNHHQLSVRLDKEEFDYIAAKANELTEGSVSKLIRMAFNGYFGVNIFKVDKIALNWKWMVNKNKELTEMVEKLQQELKEVKGND